MHRFALGTLVAAALVAGGHAFAAGADASANSDPAPAVKEQARPRDTSKHVAAKPKPHPAADSLSAAYSATQADVSAAKIRSAPPPPASSATPWTGFHVGVDAGVAK